MKTLPNIHPGEVILKEFLKPMGISQSALARANGVPPRRINELVLGKRGISADTAIRLARAFGVSERFWLGLQADYDLEEARHALAPAGGAFQVVAVLDARMDEVYAARYVWDGALWSPSGDGTVGKPEALSGGEPVDGAGWVVAGNAFEAYGERLLSGWRRFPALPTATALLRLAPALLAAGHGVAAQHALPRYIRDKVAKTTEERASEKAAALGTPIPPAPPPCA